MPYLCQYDENDENVWTHERDRYHDNANTPKKRVGPVITKVIVHFRRKKRKRRRRQVTWKKHQKMGEDADDETCLTGEALAR